MSATYSINIEHTGITQRIARMRQAVEDLTPLHANVGAGLVSNVQLGFRAGKSPWGDSWAKSKRGGQTLVDTGRLRTSITSNPDASGVTVGTNVQRYAAIHQFGGVIRAKNKPYLTFRTAGGWVRKKQVTIPARPYLPIRANGSIDLPKPWEASAATRIRAYFAKAAEA